MEPLLTVAIALTISFAFSELFYHAHYPRITGHLIGGIIIGIALVLVSPAGSLNYFEFFSELGIVFLLLLTGIEINIKRLEKVSKHAFIEALFSSVIPFTLGYATSYYLFPILFNMTIEPMTAVVIGITMSITAEATKVSILIATKTINTKLGELMVGAGIIDDIFGIFLLAVVTIKAQSDNFNGLALFPMKFFLFLALCFVIFKTIPYLVENIQKEHSDMTSFTTAIIIGLFIAAISASFGLGPIIGAFIAGIMMKIVLKSKTEEHHLIKNLKLLTMGLIIPFFFIYIGIHVDIISIGKNLPLFGLIVAVAIIGKILGSILAMPLTKLSYRQAMLVGWGMNSRGAIELVIAQIALTYGLIDRTLYSSIIGMAVITTLIFPFVLKYYITKYPHIMRGERFK